MTCVFPGVGTIAAFETDRLSAESGSPALLYASTDGVIHEFYADCVVLSEASVGASGPRATVKAVARIVVRLCHGLDWFCEILKSHLSFFSH